MLSVSSLRNAINQQLADAESKRQQAESLMKRAEQHAAGGDYARAQLDRDSAERYMRDVHGIEGTIAGYEIEIQRRQLKARDIDKQIDDLEQHFKHNLEQLQKEKDSRGIFTGSEAEIAAHHAKERSIDRKIEELEKHHRHDLEQLQKDKSDLIG